MKSNPALSLTRIFLHNWHRFSHHVIDVQDSLYLAGHNGSGKSSVLDAIQLVLIADQTRIRYNSSAQERSARNLNTYVRGKIGEDRYLRPGNAVAYIALEFQGADQPICIGVCIEASKDQSPERSFFILNEALDPSRFMSSGRPLTRRELRQALRNKRDAHFYDQVGEYQDDLLNRLGGLNPRFTDLFLRALTFQPIRDINTFVEQWLLEAQPLQVSNLKQVVENLRQLQATADTVTRKIDQLRAIVEQQRAVHTWRQNKEEYQLLAAMLRAEQTTRQRSELGSEQQQLTGELEQTRRQLADCEAAHTGAQSALIEARVRLQNSNVIQRQTELGTEIARLTREAEQIRSVYTTLLRDLKTSASQLASLRSQPHLPQLRPLLDAIAALTLSQPPAARLQALLEASERELDAAFEQAREQQTLLEQQLTRHKTERTQIEQALTHLRSGQRGQRNESVERMRDLLTEVAGERPRLLCELIEIPEERWQNAVEALLGARRFNIIVPPKYFSAALAALDRARAQESLYDVGLIDLARAQGDSRRAQPRSLAQKITTEPQLIRAYLDTILGDIITCETPDELRQHRRSVTPEVLSYSEWTVRAIPPKRYQPWFIGQRAHGSQIELREQQLREQQGHIARLEPEVQALKVQTAQLKQGRELATLRTRLDAPLDERELRGEITSLQAELDSLDVSGVAALQADVERLDALVKHTHRDERQASTRSIQLQQRLEQLASTLLQVENTLVEVQQALAQLPLSYATSQPNAATLLAERLAASGPAGSDLSDVIGNAESSSRNYDKRSENELKALIQLGSSYNTRHQFAGEPNNIDQQRYSTELERLETSELPRYRANIAQAQHEAEEELREHVLHRLNEQIQQARSRLAMINDALSTLTFHGERYRFHAQPATDMQQFYDLIEGSRAIGTGSLFESEFYRQHQASFDVFFNRLVRDPQSDAERREQERLIDYRPYLSYDIEITHADGQTSRLSRIMGQTSGGETQTPFYLTIAASFVQLYHINERYDRPTIRLVAFDEAFSKMDQDRIGATLELFQQFGLQIITATPLERCEYLVPKMCTSLVLSAAGDGVWIEPYRNYAARLDSFVDQPE